MAEEASEEWTQLEALQSLGEQQSAALSLDPQTPHQKLMAKIPQAQQQRFTGNFSLQCFKCFSQASLSLEKDLKVT